MLKLEEISDRLEIQQLLAEYATAIDAGRFDDLDDLFTDDAVIDLSATGGVSGPFGEVKAWLIETLGKLGPYGHLVSNSDLRLAGDLPGRASHTLTRPRPPAAASADAAPSHWESRPAVPMF